MSGRPWVMSSSVYSSSWMALKSLSSPWMRGRRCWMKQVLSDSSQVCSVHGTPEETHAHPPPTVSKRGFKTGEVTLGISQSERVLRHTGAVKNLAVPPLMWKHGGNVGAVKPFCRFLDSAESALIVADFGRQIYEAVLSGIRERPNVAVPLQPTNEIISQGKDYVWRDIGNGEGQHRRSPKLQS